MKSRGLLYVLWGIVGMLISAMLFLGALAFLGSGMARDWREIRWNDEYRLMMILVDEGGDLYPTPEDCTYTGHGWECGA